MPDPDCLCAPIRTLDAMRLYSRDGEFYVEGITPAQLMSDRCEVALGPYGWLVMPQHDYTAHDDGRIELFVGDRYRSHMRVSYVSEPDAIDGVWVCTLWASADGEEFSRAIRYSAPQFRPGRYGGQRDA